MQDDMLDVPRRGALKLNPRSFRVAVAVSLVGVLAACGGSADGGDDGDGGPEVDRLTVGALNPGTGIVPIWVGIEEGHFEEEGLEVEVELGGGFAEQVPLLARGDIDLAWGGNLSAFSTIAGGMDLRLVSEAELMAPEFYQVLSLEESDIEDAGDLEGRTVAINAHGGTPELGIAVGADEAGVDPGDVDLITMGLDAMPAGLERGEIDAMMLPGPRIASAMDSYDLNVVLDYAETEGLQDYPTNGYYAMADFAEEHPVAMEAFVDGLESAVAEVESDDEIQVEHRMDLADQPRELAERALADPVSGVDEQRMEDALDQALHYGVLEDEVDLGPLFGSQ